MKVWTLPTLQNVISWEELRRFTTQSLTNLSQILSKNVTFTDNIKQQIVTAVLTSGSETAIPHTLGQVPIGFITIGAVPVGGVASLSSTGWTSENIYLTTNVSGAYIIMLIC